MMNLQYWVANWGGLGVGEKQRKEPSMLGCKIGGGGFKCGGDRERDKRVFGVREKEREKNFQCWVAKLGGGGGVSGVGETERKRKESSNPDY